VEEVTKPSEEEETIELLDLAGVPEILHETFRVLEASDREGAAREIENAKRVSANKDGSVIIRLLTPVNVKNSSEDRVRLRPIKAKDYISIATEADAEDSSFAPTIRFARALATPVGIIDELDGLDDMRAIYWATLVARKNFSRPKS
jgi:hypothetical protein